LHRALGIASMTTALVFGLAVTSPASATAHGPAARISAKPSTVKVNGTTKLAGAHFPGSKTITLDECSVSGWVVTEDVCDSANSVTLTTSPKGAFRTAFSVKACRGGSASTSQTCYVGEPLPDGIDTLSLVGAVTITVTSP
jgi:hypothetical protein